MPKKIEIQTGEKYGKLTIVKEVEPYTEPSGSIRRRVICSCDCGNKKVFRISDLKSNKTISCGCYRKQNNKEINTIHGYKGTILYNTWLNMRNRCNNPNQPRYKDYGGRGIKICDRWNNFENFYKDMGPKPSKEHSIDRIDVNGNYEPSNCRWANIIQQNNNKRKNN